jgi:hypothetical protein
LIIAIISDEEIKKESFEKYIKCHFEAYNGGKQRKNLMAISGISLHRHSSR